MMAYEHELTTFVRTKQVFKNRLRNLKDYDHVKVYVYELQNLGYNNRRLLYTLKEMGEITFDEESNFKALNTKGPVKPHLLDKAKRKDKIELPLTPLHVWMRDQLKHVTLPGVNESDIPVYFRAFLDHGKTNLKAFFSVDTFSSRVHTPVVNLKGSLRFKLKFHEQDIVSLDVKQMQPTILAKVLEDNIGKNSFSDAIFRGEDVYVHIQKEANLKERDDAKKYLFQLIFGKPMDDVGKLFKGDTRWVDWINEYKTREERNNPHKEKRHTNLAWLLQYSEVQVMTGIWERMKRKPIPFLTIHDEILCIKGDELQTQKIMESELKKHFKYFIVNITNCHDEALPQPPCG